MCIENDNVFSDGRHAKHGDGRHGKHGDGSHVALSEVAEDGTDIGTPLFLAEGGTSIGTPLLLAEDGTDMVEIAVYGACVPHCKTTFSASWRSFRYQVSYSI